MDDTPLFENRSLIDKAQLGALMRHSLTKPRAWGIFVFPLIVIVIIELVSPSDSDGMLTWGIILVILAASYAYGIRRAVNKALKARQQMHQGTLPETVVRFFEDEILVQEGNNSSHYPYTALRSAERFGNNIALYILDGRQALLLDIDGFTVGTPDSLPGFLHRKTPGLKIKL